MLGVFFGVLPFVDTSFGVVGSGFSGNVVEFRVNLKP